MLIRYKHLLEGPGPSEAIVGVQTTAGRMEQVVVDKSVLKGEFLDVGPSLSGASGSEYLIQLPREAASGSLRVWIPATEVVKEKQAA